MPLIVPHNPYTAAVQRLNLLGPDLVAARTRLGLTATTQAAAIGITKTTLAGITSGSSNPTRSTTVACLRWLGAN